MDNPWVNRQVLAKMQEELNLLATKYLEVVVERDQFKNLSEKLSGFMAEQAIKHEKLEADLYEEYDKKVQQTKDNLVEMIDIYLQTALAEITAEELKEKMDAGLNGQSVMQNIGATP